MPMTLDKMYGIDDFFLDFWVGPMVKVFHNGEY